MGLLSNICSPAIIYLAFSLTQVIIDTYKRAYNIAFVKFIQMIVFTLLLNLLCIRGLTWVSWLIIAIPFIFMGFMTYVLLFILKLDNTKTVILDDDSDQDSDEESVKDSDKNSHQDSVDENKSFDVYYWGHPKKYSISSGEFVS
tara:strand:- start:9912 stop:10343 length:432 start_codon:yes stop_codon:yes gene_type:complete